MIVVACSIVYSSYGGAGIRDSQRFSPSYSEKQLNAIDLWTSNLGDGEYTVSGTLQRSAEETSIYSTTLTEISTYAQQCSLQFLTVTMSLEDDWDGYVEQVEALGLEELLAVCQAPYDRYADAMDKIE